MDQQVVVLPSPHTQFNPVPRVCLYDSPFQITQASELSGLNGNYSFVGKGVGSDGMFNPSKAGPGSDSLLYVFTGSDGCRDSAMQSIQVIAPPRVNAGSDTAVVVNQPLQLQAVSSDTGPDTFSWSPIEGLNDPGISNPVAVLGSAVDSIWYVVRVTDTAGCYGEDSILVRVFKTLPNIFVPNAFTPGSSINNVFRPIPVGISSLQYFKIYNRWGQLVFSTNRMGEGWDGNIGGKPQGTDSYVWMVEGTTYTGKIITKKGTMTLIR
jgi:gliding motility-associated-like protein